MDEERYRPRYVIHVAAELIGVKTHTLRYYERSGLVKPQRSPGNIRLYSESDIEILRRVRSLMDDLGVNMAGVEVITNMLEKMTEVMRENEKLRAEVLRLQRGKS
ncbi:MerR family transcriptional regulator [Dehalogenimonas etheniformans]|uniref:MerR family DNA-binding transcriptional regulator n=1 Tax=Dehalogenimonas etheniformans TaxID=1536648 RepID=A0A2P5P6R6_9CHLR|nr:MerR family transcriptional regulator [Dehalogenimonas etheniformans]PPD57988.1 MerR family DNA-binding transcriptional regulator [Dehalogenimonas etheniformans]QNT75338.1 MerR family transcriptional regulator [Dehalogenimonas etheniformans]